MTSSFSNVAVCQQTEAVAFGSRMEAATQALLRIRDEVIATLDRQVVELRELHQTLASPPPPMVISDDQLQIPPAPLAAALPPARRHSLFEDAPRVAVQAVPPVAKAPVPSTAPLAPAPVMQATPQFQPQYQAAQVVAIAEEPSDSFSEKMLDPMLEQATLEELNQALASAFAMMSARSER